MAEFPTFDLLSEIDELATFVDGKGVENNFNFLVDEDLDVSSSDLPPSYGLFRGDDSMLAVDSCNNLLMDDPLLNRPLFDQGELLDLQPATPGFNPETLIPVSLPADSSTRAVDQPPADPEEDTSAEEADCEESQEPENITPESTTVDESTANGIDSTTLVPDASPTPCHNRRPVRIIVNTRRKSTSKMVAPVLLPKPTHNLVKIPKAVPSTSVVRLRRIHTGEKLMPTEEENSADVDNRDEERVEPSAKKQQHERKEDSRRVSVSSDTSSEQDDVPFWSLRSRHSSITSVTSQTSGTKRKAYELDPLGDPQMERCRRNAINAKKNRELKKKHMEELERRVEDVSRERDQLAGENESLKNAKLKLEQQVKHLNNILKNQSQLSALIGKLTPTSVVLGDLSTSGNEDEIVSSGMCLHVDGQEATIEYCSYCAKKAGKKLSI